MLWTIWKSTKLLEIYLKENNISILLWNYKGYGLRKGWTTFRTIDNDIEILINYIKKNFPNYKFIVHGLSIGGYSAIRISEKLLNNNNVVLICDRTYGDINLIIKDLSYGNFLEKIYQFLFPKFFYNTSNVINYLKVKGKKIILFDENDETINYNSSLFFNLNLEYFNKIIYPEIVKFFNKETFLCSNLNYNEYTFLNLFFENKKDLYELKNDIKYLYEHKSNLNKNDDLTKYFVTQLYETNLQNFIIFFLSLGFPFNKYKEIPYDKEEFNKLYKSIPTQMKKIFVLYNNLFSERLKDFLSKLNLLFVKINLESSITEQDISSFSYELEQDFQIKKNLNEIINIYFGSVHRIFCGHNGTLNNNDEEFLNDYFESKQFILINEEDKGIN